MAEAQESSSPRCLLLLAGGLPSSVSGTILLTGACKPLAYGTRLSVLSVVRFYSILCLHVNLKQHWTISAKLVSW